MEPVKKYNTLSHCAFWLSFNTHIPTPQAKLSKKGMVGGYV